MTLKEKRAAALKAATDIINGASASGRDLTDEEITQVEAKHAEVKDLDAQIERATKSQALAAELGQMGRTVDTAVEQGGTDETPAKNIADHFRKHAAKAWKASRGIPNAVVSAPEFKAATDTQVTTGSVWGVVLTEVDRTIVTAPRRPLTIADLLAPGTLGANSNAVTYFVEGSVEGDFDVVAEGAHKPQIHVADPTTRTDALRKIAAFYKNTDEMSEDLDFFLSEVQNRGLYMLAAKEEAEILRGDGTGQHLLGLLNRSGVQTITRGTGTDVAADEPRADAIFRGMTACQTGSGFPADALVIHPLDYQRERLAKDGNGQYLAGGPFTGPYGNGAILEQPALWGLRTVVTPAANVGEAVVGAFRSVATLYRKGGVRVESTNSNADDFENNKLTTRIEERVALACRVPTGIVKVELPDPA